VTSLYEEEIHEARLQVIDRVDRLVVTVIELLSPTNKYRGARGREDYEAKRSEIMRSASHLVEIDLLRQGLRVPIQEEIPPCDYMVHISKVSQPPKGRLFPIMLELPLKAIPIPLRAEDPDVLLDLQSVLNTAYDRAAYDMDIDYTREPNSPLPPQKAEWAGRLLKEKGLR
jgi:hypothetical protein